MKIGPFLTWIMFLPLAGAILAPLLISDDYVSERYLPSAFNLFLFFLCIILSLCIRDTISRVIASGWALWFLVGNVFVLGSYLSHRLIAPLYVQDANTTYLAAILFFTMGMISFERLVRYDVLLVRPRRASVPPPLVWGALAFPLVYWVSLFVWRVPTILEGTRIVEQMYEVNKGPIYGLRIALVLSVLLVVTRGTGSNSRRRSLLILAASVSFLFISILDGKRDVALVAVAGVAIHIFLVGRGRVRLWYLAVFAATAVMYGAISDLRAGSLPSQENIVLAAMTSVGVEYKDFVHSVNHSSPEEMRYFGYDWVRSSVASILNRSILGAFGVDKDQWSDMDSAHSWMRFYGISLGIRTGIVSELYFAFGVYYLIGIFVIGFFISGCVFLMRTSRTELSYLYWMSIVAVFSILVTNQTSSVLGSVVTLTYVFASLWILSYATRGRMRRLSSNSIALN